MKKIYLVVLVLLSCSGLSAQTLDPLRCTENQVRFADTNICAAYVYNIDPVVHPKFKDLLTYNFSGATKGSGTGSASGQLFNIGITTVSYQVGRYDSCSFQVEVTDLFYLRPAVKNLDTITICQNAKLPVPVALSFCTGQPVEGFVVEGFSTSELVSNKTIWWVYAYNGQWVLRQPQVVNVVPGNLLPRKDPLETITANCSYKVGKPPFLVNECTGERVYANDPDTTEFTTPGVHYIEWRYGIGRRPLFVEKQAVVIEGTEGLKLPELQTDTIKGQCDVTYTGIPVAVGGCYGEKIAGVTEDRTNFTQSGLHTILWLFRFNNKIYRQERLVYVDLDPKFVFSKAGSDTIYASCSKTITDFPVAVYCSGAKLTGEPLNDLSYTKPGTYKLQWLYRYKNDTAVQTQYLVIRENGTFIPKEKVLARITAGCSTTVSLVPLAIYGCSGVEVAAKPDRSLTFTKQGIDTINWVYTYNDATFIQQQIVEISGSGGLEAEVKELPTLKDDCNISLKEYPKAKDGCSGLVVTATTKDPLQYTRPGRYVVNWSYYVNEKEVLKQEQVVVIGDGPKLKAMVDILPVIEGSCNAVVTNTPVAVNRCTRKQVEATTRDPLKYDEAGTYSITWLYRDGEDTLTQQQTVTVQASGSFTFKEKELAKITAGCSTTVTHVPTALFGCDGVEVSAKADQPLNFTKPGAYIITWNYTYQGKTAQQKQSVEVTGSGTLVPGKEVLPAVTGSCNITITEIPTATNDCSGAVIKGETEDPLSYNKPGEYIVNWRYIVADKVLLTQQQKVIIKDLARLQPTINELKTITGNCSAVITEAPTALNSCTGKLVKGVTKDPLSYKIPGTYSITWEYTDGTTIITQQQKVIVKSSEQLITEQIVLPDLTGECEVVVTKLPLAANACSGLLLKGTTTDPLRYTQPGTYTITWIFKDGGVETKQTQKVIVSGRPDVLKIYPNPTRNEFRIVAEGCNLPEAIYLKIFDITGKLMDRKTIQSNKEVVFGAAYQGGVYILQVTQGDKVSVMKLVKAK